MTSAIPDGGQGAGAAPVAPSLTLSLLNFAPAGSVEPTDLAARVLRRAALADRVGIDRVTVVDHVVMGDRIDAYDGGRFPTGPDGLWLEPLTLLAAIAGITRRLRLATAIVVAPLRRAPALAKAVATLDVVAGGRVELGVGVGWQREEYDASGVPFAGRGDELDRVLGELRRLWRGEAVLAATAADGSTETAGARVWCEPRPVQPGGVPLWISGRLHGRTLDRMVRFGDGWIPWGDYRRDVVAGIPRVRAALETAGRDPAGFGVRGTLPVVMDDAGRVDGDRTVARVPAMVDAGVTDFGLSGAFSDDDDTAGDQLSAVVSAFAGATGRVGAAS